MRLILCITILILLGAITALGSPPDRRGDASKHFKRGNALYARGNVQEAVGEFRAALQIDPTFARAHESLGVALENLGNLDAAMAEYREAVRLKPDDPFAHDNLGRTLLKKGDADAAIAEHSQALRLKPDDPFFHRNLGLAFKQKGDNAAALDEYRTASQLEARGPQSVGNDVSAPVPIFRPEPADTKQARNETVTRVVMLLIVVDTQGNVAEVQQASKPLGKGLDEKAIETVRTWKFKPATRDGVPVAVRVTVEISFRLF